MSRRAVASIVFAAALVVAAFPLAVLASHQFNDVPDDNTFHADISAIADAGVTTGCGGGNYCPKDYVTREQMAAFLNRLGALAPGKTPVANAAKLVGFSADQFARADVAVTGHVVCQGSTLVPLGSGSVYLSPGNALQLTSGNDWFGCEIRMPDGATVVALRAAIYDTSSTEQVTCALEYQPALTYDGVLSQMANVFSGEVFAGGDILAEDITISSATVDNATNSYWALCRINGTGADILLASVNVEYTSEGLPVP